MKKSDYIRLTIAFIIIFLIALGINKAVSQNTLTVNFRNIKVDTIKANYVSQNLNFPYIKSCERFTTLFKVERNGKSYYVNSILIIRNEMIEFTDYKRNGELRGSYRFPLTEVKIYQSK